MRPSWTEREWLGCREWPGQMLHFLHQRASARKLRLFACACCRRVWPLLTVWSRSAVEISEAFADGLAGRRALADAARLALGAYSEPRLPSGARVRHARVALAHARADQLVGEAAYWAAAPQADAASWGVLRLATAMKRRGSTSGPAHAARKERIAQCDLLRELFGNPFRPARVESSWLAWDDGVLVRLALAIYHERAFDRLPILADALEEAGCTNPTILSHCRRPGGHALGCWVLDALLGKD